MKIALVFAAVAVTLGAACDTSDVLDAYASARQSSSDCNMLITSLSPFFFNGDVPDTGLVSPHCFDECSLRFMWNLYEAGCASQPDASSAFTKVMDVCGCDLDQYFIDNGGRCITNCRSGSCAEAQGGGHRQDPYISTADGHRMVVHVQGASLTLEADQSSGSRSQGAVGFCDGSYVEWDHEKDQCVPKIEFLAAGSRLLPVHGIASRADISRVQESLIELMDRLEARMHTTASGVVQATEVVLAESQGNLDEVSAIIESISGSVEQQVEASAQVVEDRVAEVSADLEANFADLQATIQENVIDQVNALSSVADDVDVLMEAFEHTAFLDHSKPVYRWATWGGYNQWQGWSGHGHHGDHMMFGGVEPQQWGDSNGRAWQLSGDKNVLRGLFNKRGYMGWQGTVWHEEWMSHSSTSSKHSGVLFRIKNSQSNTITWRPRFYYTSYSGWGERASVTVNGQSTWESGGNACGHSCTGTPTCNIPGGRTSTVIIISGSSPRSSGCCDFGPRGHWLAFRDNSLQLPNGLEYVDDMDYAAGGWER